MHKALHALCCVQGYPMAIHLLFVNIMLFLFYSPSEHE